MRTWRSPLSITCPLVAGSGWGSHVRSPSGLLWVLRSFAAPPCLSCSIRGWSQVSSPCPALLPLLDSFPRPVVALNPFLTCLRLEAKEGAGSKKLSSRLQSQTGALFSVPGLLNPGGCVGISEKLSSYLSPPAL